MRSPACNHNPLDWRTADVTGLSFALIYFSMRCEAAFLAMGVNIITITRATVFETQVEDGKQFFVQ